MKNQNQPDMETPNTNQNASAKLRSKDGLECFVKAMLSLIAGLLAWQIGAWWLAIPLFINAAFYYTLSSLHAILDLQGRKKYSNDGTERRGRPAASESQTDVARPRSLQ